MCRWVLRESAEKEVKRIIIVKTKTSQRKLINLINDEWKRERERDLRAVLSIHDSSNQFCPTHLHMWCRYYVINRVAFTRRALTKWPNTTWTGNDPNKVATAKPTDVLRPFIAFLTWNSLLFTVLRSNVWSGLCDRVRVLQLEVVWNGNLRKLLVLPLGFAKIIEIVHWKTRTSRPTWLNKVFLEL